jgi:hypothetical protein
MPIQASDCPVCHKPTALAYNQRYCPACGWNAEGAIAAVRSSFIILPFGMLLFAAFALFLISRLHFRNKYQIAIFCIVPAIGILVNFLSLARARSRLQALPEAMRIRAANAAAVAGASFTAPRNSLLGPASPQVAEPSAADLALLRSSRPREIRMSTRGRFGLTAAVLMAVGFAVAIAFHLYALWAPTQSFARFHTSDWITLVVGILLALLPWGIWRSQVKECDLLENGEIAIATVTRQWSDEQNSSIECEYKGLHRPNPQVYRLRLREKALQRHDRPRVLRPRKSPPAGSLLLHPSPGRGVSVVH